MKTIVCTACSRKKDTRKELIPARERYKGSHIKEVEDIAKREGRPLFFLSGLFGFVLADGKLPAYDFVLTEFEADRMVGSVALQLLNERVSEIHFYSKAKESWRLYEEVIIAAAEKVSAVITIHYLKDDA